MKVIPSVAVGALGFVLGWAGSASYRVNDVQDAPQTQSSGAPTLLSERKAGALQKATMDLAYAPPMAPGDFPRRLQELAESKGRVSQDQLGLLLDEWVAYDPVAAMEACDGLSSAALKKDALSLGILSWGMADFDAALDYARALPEDFSERKRLIGNLVELWAKEDLDTEGLHEALEFVHGEALRHRRSWAQLYEKLAERDLKSALAYAKKSKSIVGWEGLLRVWMERDPQDAVSAFVQQSGMEEWETARKLRDYVPDLLGERPLETYAFLLELIPNKFHSEELHEAFAKAWFEEDPEAASAWVSQERNDQHRDAMVRAIGLKLVGKNPGAAFALMRKEGQTTGLGQIASQWAQKDWASAYQAMDTLANDQAAEVAAARSLLAAQPENATSEQLERLLGVLEREGAEFHTWSFFQRMDTDEVGKLLATFPRALGSGSKEFLVKHAKRRPREALEMAQQLTGEGSERVVQSLVVTWTQNDPSSVNTWLGQLPPGERRTLAYSNYMNALTRNDPDAAFSAFRELPEDVKDAAGRELVTIAMPYRPAEALQVALSLEQRAQMVPQVMAQWHRLNPASANKAIEDLEPGLRAEVERRLEW